MLVYPRLRSLILTLVLFAVFGLLSLPLSISRLSTGSIFEGLAFAALGLGCIYGLLVSGVQLVRPVPYASLDEHGLACAAGSVAWDDVSDVSTYLRYGATQGKKRMLCFRFAPGTEVRPPGRKFLNTRLFGRPEVWGTALVFPAWTRKDDALAAIRRFYDGPVEG